MDEKIIVRKKIFLRFLKENNSLKSFLQNFNMGYFYGNIDELVKYEIICNSCNEISSTFSWAMSKEGFNHWDNLDRKWRKLLKEKKYFLGF